MPRTTVVIVGAGQAGLAMSHCLAARGLDHTVLERGNIGERWRRHGWDSLRLLTPNWMTRLPGYQYCGPDPDGFMTTRELVQFFEGYAAASHAPVEPATAVRHIAPAAEGFTITTDTQVWRASSVVVATGYCDRPAIPRSGQRLAPWVEQVAPEDYRNPERLPPGGVLVVGASATGVQIADELQRAGRDVVLAVGRHTRLPRTYRGRDILWWLDRLGVLAQDTSQVQNLAASRSQPSLQLVGRPDRATVDLARLRASGVRLTGRVTDIAQNRVRFADDLIATTAAADVKLAMIMTRIDDFISRTGIEADARGPFVPTWSLAEEPVAEIDLAAERISTVIWATGYRRLYPWLRVPVLDRQGEIQHTAGVTRVPGLYVLGLNFQRRRNSSFIDGVGSDAEYLARIIAARSGASALDRTPPQAHRYA